MQPGMRTGTCGEAMTHDRVVIRDHRTSRRPGVCPYHQRTMQTLRNAPLTRRMMFVLLAVVLLAQSIGVLHRVVHYQPPESARTQLAAESPNVFHALWGDHSKGSDCRAWDHNCPDLLTHGSSPMAPLVLPGHGIDPPVAAGISLIEHFYLAQGPPSSWN